MVTQERRSSHSLIAQTQNPVPWDEGGTGIIGSFSSQSSQSSAASSSSSSSQSSAASSSSSSSAAQSSSASSGPPGGSRSSSASSSSVVQSSSRNSSAMSECCEVPGQLWETTLRSFCGNYCFAETDPDVCDREGMDFVCVENCPSDLVGNTRCCGCLPPDRSGDVCGRFSGGLGRITCDARSCECSSYTPPICGNGIIDVVPPGYKWPKEQCDPGICAKCQPPMEGGRDRRCQRGHREVCRSDCPGKSGLCCLCVPVKWLSADKDVACVPRENICQDDCTCRPPPPFCGDEILQEDRGEECDSGGVCAGGTQDGYRIRSRADVRSCYDGGGVPRPLSNDGCSWTCRKEYCGDGVTQPPGQDGRYGTDDDEECDNGSICSKRRPAVSCRKDADCTRDLGPCKFSLWPLGFRCVKDQSYLCWYHEDCIITESCVYDSAKDERCSETCKRTQGGSSSSSSSSSSSQGSSSSFFSSSSSQSSSSSSSSQGSSSSFTGTTGTTGTFATTGGDTGTFATTGTTGTTGDTGTFGYLFGNDRCSSTTCGGLCPLGDMPAAWHFTTSKLIGGSYSACTQDDCTRAQGHYTVLLVEETPGVGCQFAVRFDEPICRSGTVRGLTGFMLSFFDPNDERNEYYTGISFIGSWRDPAFYTHVSWRKRPFSCNAENILYPYRTHTGQEGNACLGDGIIRVKPGPEEGCSGTTGTFGTPGTTGTTGTFGTPGTTGTTGTFGTPGTTGTTGTFATTGGDTGTFATTGGTFGTPGTTGTTGTFGTPGITGTTGTFATTGTTGTFGTPGTTGTFATTGALGTPGTFATTGTTGTTGTFAMTAFPPPLFCGNFILNEGEECDDGNHFDFDGCTSDCQLELGRCGDGILQKLLGETCEPPLVDPSAPFSCGKDCRLVSKSCGDSRRDPPEECDEGRQNTDAPNARCRKDCALRRCGDGILDPQFEGCDDGNRVGGDGCNRLCSQERSPNIAAFPPLPTVPQMPPYAFLPPGQVSGVSFPFPDARFPIQTSIGPDGQLLGSFLLPPPTYYLPSRLPAQPKTGPEILAIMAAGAAGGLAYMRRRRR